MTEILQNRQGKFMSQSIYTYVLLCIRCLLLESKKIVQHSDREQHNVKSKSKAFIGLNILDVLITPVVSAVVFVSEILQESQRMSATYA